MRKIDFNQNWRFKRCGEAGEGRSVIVPHDAMRTEKRSAESRGEHNIGWYESYDYEYTKTFSLPAELPRTKVILEFEGVYHDAEVFLDGKKVAYRPYGYTNFYVDITAQVQDAAAHELRVIAHNADQPNSRWYSGSGIYRPVWLYVAGEQYIKIEGITVETLLVAGESSAKLRTKIETSCAGEAKLAILDDKGTVIAQNKVEAASNVIDTTWTLNDITPWDVDHPAVYTLQVTFGDDVVSETFGIRTLTWTPENGIAMNGRHVIIKGACIHHDNGVLGACAFPEAEERKIRILKENGYNAIRSAHNPCSKAMLDACDRLGVMVMDEYTDMWYIHKNKYDYASKMTDWWKQDLVNMVGKDKNHPSVILYSTGNEVAETGQARGIQLTKDMTEYLHSLDATRPVTCGINIFFNALYSMGFGVYSDDKAEKESKKQHAGKGKKKTVGSEFYNTLAGLLGDKTMKFGATLPICDRKTKDAYAAMDVAGYNYGIARYRHDLKAYPNRLILGSETFCKDAYSFYELAKKEPRIVGDFVWAGMDYIGEAGIGAWEYEDYAPKDADKSGWLTAGSGRLNILGFPSGEAAYTKVAFEAEKGPRMAVKPVYQKGSHSPSAWKMTDAMESWSWPGCEGSMATVEVYARAAYVKLFLNKKIVGKDIMDGKCVTVFKVPYEPGVLTVISYRKDGSEIGRYSLQSAGEDATLQVTPEENTVAAGGLSFVRLRYTDAKGIWKPMEKHHLKVSVTNGTLEGFGNACAYNPDGYDKDETGTYYGEAMAVVRAGDAGSVTVTVSDEDHTFEEAIPIRQL